MNYRLLRVSLRNIEDRNFEIEFGEDITEGDELKDRKTSKYFLRA